jgi:hypothetical protein
LYYLNHVVGEVAADDSIGVVVEVEVERVLSKNVHSPVKSADEQVWLHR